MNNQASSNGAVGEGGGAGGGVRYYKKDFWSKENLKFAKLGFRQQKSIRIVNRLADGRSCDLLDVGCGPAAIQPFMHRNVNYYGIDIAIQEPAPNLIEVDFLEEPIAFQGKKFDIVLAQGVFEYVGDFQSAKFAEIGESLKEGGRFVVSYVNFGHRDREIYWPYSNVQPLADFRASLARHFRIDRSFPTSHNWRHSEPNKRFLQAAQIHLNVTIPVVSPVLAVEYFFLCSAPASKVSS